jgi:chromosome segregation ATPase
VRRASRRLERGLKDITAEAVRKGAEIKELRRRLTVVEAALDVATEEASKAEAEAGATKEKLVEEKMKTKVLRESNKDLKERLAELENAVFELEEKLEEEGFKKTVKGFERARAEQSKVDGLIDELYDEKSKLRGAGR